MSYSLGLIYAQSLNGVIGANGKLPWHLPMDLEHFKQKTLGCTVVMGRKTWESLPESVRPLPGRRNIVVSSQPAWAFPEVAVAHSLQAALAACHEAGTATWVIGGGELLAQALPFAVVIVRTVVGRDVLGDVYAPTLGPEWQVASSDAVNDHIPLVFETLIRGEKCV